MTSAATDVHDGPARPSPAESSRWLLAGRAATLAAIVVLVLLQEINHDWFPPDISVSQYGVGPRGWVFSCWAALLALSMLALTLGGPAVDGRTMRTVHGWVAAGIVGLLVMGIVRTDTGGAQHSWHAKVHMAGSILALLALPVGIVLALGWARRSWRLAALTLTAISAAALVLVVGSAFGLATLGMDAPHSWAFWQSVAVTVDMALVSVFALAGFAGRDAPSVRVTPP